MSLSQKSSFRRSAYALATVAGLLFANAALAQERQAMNASPLAEPITLQTDCKKYKVGVLFGDGECEIRKSALLEAQKTELDRQKVCLLKLVEFKKADPAKFKTLGRVTRENACDLAGRTSKPTANAAPSVGG